MNEETRNIIVTALSEISWCIGYTNSEQLMVNLKVARKLLRKALNSLQEEPKEQKSGVWIDGEWREIRMISEVDERTDKYTCPFDGCSDAETTNHVCPKCHGEPLCISGNWPEGKTVYFMVAPAPITQKQEPECPTCKNEGVILRPSSDGEEAHEWPCPENCQALKELDSFYWSVVEERREIKRKQGDK